MKRLLITVAAIALMTTACGDSKDGDKSLSGAAVATTTTAKPTTTTAASTTIDSGDLVVNSNDSSSNGGEVTWLTLGYKSFSRDAAEVHDPNALSDGKAYAQLKRVTWLTPPTGNLTLVMFFPPAADAAYNEFVNAFDNASSSFATVTFSVGSSFGTTGPGRPISGAVRAHSVGTTTGGKTATLTIQPVHQQVRRNDVLSAWGY